MRMFKLTGLVTVLALAGAFATPGAEEKPMGDQVKDAIQLFKNDDSKIVKLFESA